MDSENVVFLWFTRHPPLEYRIFADDYFAAHHPVIDGELHKNLTSGGSVTSPGLDGLEERSACEFLCPDACECAAEPGISVVTVAAGCKCEFVTLIQVLEVDVEQLDVDHPRCTDVDSPFNIRIVDIPLSMMRVRQC